MDGFVDDAGNMDNLAVSDIDRLVDVLRFLHENKLLSDARDHLKANGFPQFKISVEPFRELQRFLRDEMVSGRLQSSAQGNATIMCGKGNASCSSKPK